MLYSERVDALKICYPKILFYFLFGHKSLLFNRTRDNHMRHMD